MPRPGPLARIVLLATLIGGVLAQAPPAVADATITVNTTVDEYGEGSDCSLREAISNAASDGGFGGGCVGNGTFGDDTILVPPGTYTLTRNGPEDQSEKDLDLITGVGGDLTIQSDGGTAQNTIVQAGTTGSSNGVAGNGLDRVFEVTSTDPVTIRNLTIRNGNTSAGGGGIRSQGTLHLEDSIVMGSFAAGQGGGILNDQGTLTILRSAVIGNHSGTDGGGIFSRNSLRVDSSTLSGNTTTGTGGGLSTTVSGTNVLTGTTVASNAVVATGRIAGSPAGGGIYQGGTTQVFLQGSVIADNTAPLGPDCDGTIEAAGTDNIIENGASCTFSPAGVTITDPQLQPLTTNPPGATPTHALPPTSPAVDHFDSECVNGGGTFSGQPTDQRGVPRPQGAACDSGAYELQPSDGVPGICKGKTASLTGTQGSDSLIGTNGNDVIAALDGNDTVKAGKGKDLVCGGDGNDKLNGSAGNDKLLGEAGNDKLKGGGGNDKMVGAKGNDKCSGGGGDRDRAKKCERGGGVP